MRGGTEQTAFRDRTRSFPFFKFLFLGNNVHAIMQTHVLNDASKRNGSLRNMCSKQ